MKINYDLGPKDIPVAKEVEVGFAGGLTPPRPSLSNAFNSAAGMVKDAYVPRRPQRTSYAAPVPKNPPAPSTPVPAPTAGPTAAPAKPAAPVHIAPAHYHDAFNIDQMLGNALAAATFFLQGIREDSLAADVMRAAVSGDADAMRKLLARPDVLPELQNAQGLTPLMAAAARGHGDIVELLASHPLVNPGAATESGWTALHYAAHFGQEDSVRILLKHLAPPEAKTARGDEPYDIAKGKPVENAFWQDKNFIIYMKRNHRDDPHLQKPAVKTEPQRPALPPVPLAAQPFEAMTGAQLEKAFADNPNNDWADTFVKAAALGNAPALFFLDGKFTRTQEVLDRALSAAIRDGDNASAVAELVDQGANPDGRYAFSGGALSIYQQAFNMKRTGAVEEMTLWSPRPPGSKAMVDSERDAVMENITTVHGLIDDARKQWDGQKELPVLQEKLKLEEARYRTATLWSDRTLGESFSRKQLQEKFLREVEGNNIEAAMATFAAGRKDKMFTGRVEFDHAAGGRAIALALLNKRYHFARLLTRAGFTMKEGRTSDLVDKIEAGGDADAKQLLDIYSGKVSWQNPERMKYFGLPIVPLPQRSFP